jgi:hypothetical protein
MANKVTVSQAVMAEQIATINSNVAEIKDKLEKEYVTKDKLQLYCDRLERMEKIVYTVVGLILTGFVVAIIKLVIIP